MNFESQEQREALIRLLIASRYEDRLLSEAEAEAFAAHVAQLGWDSVTPVEEFVQIATAEVRQALRDPGTREFFFQSNVDPFVTIEEKTAALDHIHAVLEADGLVPAENKLFSHIRSLMNG